MAGSSGVGFIIPPEDSQESHLAKQIPVSGVRRFGYEWEPEACGVLPMDSLLQALCFCTALASAPYPHVSQRAGDITYTHEVLRHGHLLRLSTTDLIIDSNHYREERLYAFAYRFAEATCPGQFQIAETDRPSWPRLHPRYAKQYLFRCR
jgi:hypothetical protein